MGRSVGVRFWPELPLMIRAANGGCEPTAEVSKSCCAHSQHENRRRGSVWDAERMRRSLPFVHGAARFSTAIRGSRTKRACNEGQRPTVGWRRNIGGCRFIVPNLPMREDNYDIAKEPALRTVGLWPGGAKRLDSRPGDVPEGLKAAQCLRGND